MSLVLSLVMAASFSSDAVKKEDRECLSPVSLNSGYKNYLNAMKSIYGDVDISRTCLPYHFSCGFSSDPPMKPNLPTYVLSVGLEGAGHHLWTEILDRPLFDCVWINGRHYARDTADGVPRTTVAELKRGFLEQFKLRKDNNQQPCRTIYDAEDSFPTGAIRKSGRVFMRPDIVNLQQLDGVLFNLKYLVILRNTTVSANLISDLGPASTSTLLYSFHTWFLYCIYLCYCVTSLSRQLLTYVGHSYVGSAQKLFHFCGTGVAHRGAHSHVYRGCAQSSALQQVARGTL